MQLPPRLQANLDWALIPGPVNQIRPMSSLDLQEIVELPAAEVAESFLAFPDMRLVQPAEPDWWAWRARWESPEGFIALHFTLFDELGDIWGGSKFASDCPPSALISLLYLAEISDVP
jgi:hypothetical protein